ncbi:unnamed protein product [Durusdinium trenchii]|uniref:Uncharacterized protein n=1 Tax=Durusdinium trenchii TaxID=1381693 RepID=A0ABP0PF95_9DINO
MELRPFDLDMLLIPLVSQRLSLRRQVLTSRPLRHEERDWSKGGLQKPEGGRSNRLGNIQCTRQTSPMSQCVQEKARDFLFAVGPWDSLEAHGSLRRLYNIFDSSGCFKVCIDS